MRTLRPIALGVALVCILGVVVWMVGHAARREGWRTTGPRSHKELQTWITEDPDGVARVTERAEDGDRNALAFLARAARYSDAGIATDIGQRLSRLAAVQPRLLVEILAACDPEGRAAAVDRMWGVQGDYPVTAQVLEALRNEARTPAEVQVVREVTRRLRPAQQSHGAHWPVARQSHGPREA